MIKKASSNLSLVESIYDAKCFVDGEPFLLVLGDEILGNNALCSKTLVEKYNELKSPILAVKKVNKNNIKNYGIVEGKQYKDNLKELKFALSIDEERFDCGSKLGLVKANISMDLKNPEISQELKNYLKKLLEQ